MPGGVERTLRRRIRSVKATRKITKAMELIAASQIPRATARIATNRRYRDGMRAIVLEAARSDQRAAATMVGTPETVETAMVLSIIGDRGLSGAYNSSVLRATERLISDLKRTGIESRLITIGKKGPVYFRFRGLPVERSFQGFSDKPVPGDVREVAAALAGPFLAGEAQQIMLVSTSFRSAASQVVEARQLLPLTVEQSEVDDADPGPHGYTEFEPEVGPLLAELAPVALESEIFTALLEGAAAFHTSQQRAMAAATDNADDLTRTLTRVMNRARQDSITTEIMEIVGGAEALRSGK